MTNTRLSPDELLTQLAAHDKKAARGKLKIFFGSNAGVGKTYAMLDEARKRAAEGVQVLVGYAEPHIRPDTEALLLGLDILPYKLVEHKGSVLKEFDLDTALARHPVIICIDELAHTNAPGLRHPKRWQDVYELLDAGINVYATLNVQHLESVNDIVERITSVKVRETLPDRVLEEADEVELIDISPDELIERLREGKIYKPQRVEHALKHFFNRGNLNALRELALRRTAERVDAQMRDSRRAAGSTQVWAASERLMVCVGPSPFAQQLVRATKRLAVAHRAPWFAVSVEDLNAPLAPDDRVRLAETLQLAEQLGAQIVTLTGHRVADEMLAFARQKNITKIAVGKPEQPRWREMLRGSIVDDLIRHSGTIDVYVIRHDRDTARSRGPRPIASSPDTISYVWAAAVCLLATAAGMFIYHILGNRGQRFSNTNVLMIDLLAVLFVATRFGRGPAIAASLACVAAFDFTVVPPYYSFSVTDSQYLFTFLVMLITAILISTLADRIRRQADAARQRERRTAALLSLSRDLAATRERAGILDAAIRHVAEVFDSAAALFIPNAQNQLALAQTSRDIPPIDDKELGVVQWVFDHGQPAGRGTDTLPSAAGVYLPMLATRGAVGVLGLLDPPPIEDAERLRLLEAFASQSALALERAILADESRRAWERVEAEFLRNTLLSGVSHDLRTPLATITGAASLLTDPAALEPAARSELALDIVSEAGRMDRLITNLLDMTRLEAGGFTLHKDWHPLNELLGAAIRGLRSRLANHPLHTRLPADLPLVHVDDLAIQQVLANLLENAAAYTPPGAPIDISASINTIADLLTFDIADHGPGLPPGDPQQVFQKFFRGLPHPPHTVDDGSRRGAGLGLAICKGIIQLHGGTITAGKRHDGSPGALFHIELPTGGTAPTVPSEGDSTPL